MPFDPTPPDLSFPSLPNLAYALRHKETWPKNFPEWDYAWWGCCAATLAGCLWGFEANWLLPKQIATKVGRTREHETYAQWRKRTAAVTPEHVADAIDRYLATGELP